MNQPDVADEPASENIYIRAFWLSFVANFLLVTANTLTFRFAEYVKFLGGNEEMTGRIVSIGLVGSLFWRAFLGQAIDRFGVRKVWIGSSGAYLLGLWMILKSPDIGWELYAARILFALGLASMFAAALAHVQGLAPASRRTEIIGTYGASGFLGMICGAQLSDLIFHTFPESRGLYQVLFGLSMAMGAAHVALGILITAGHNHVSPDVTPPMHRLLLRYCPATVFVVTAMMGLSFAVTTVFLTRYATELGLSGIRTFFSAYAITAFVMRFVARNWSRTSGRHRLIVYGLATHALGQLGLVFVTRDWQFIPSAISFGFGHALLFPCVVSLGAGAFPEQYRGTGTTIVLAAIDVGVILTAPVLGWIIDTYGFRPMLHTVCLTLAAASGLYAALTWRIADTDSAPARRRRKAAAADVGSPVVAIPAQPVCPPATVESSVQLEPVK